MPSKRNFNSSKHALHWTLTWPPARGRRAREARREHLPPRSLSDLPYLHLPRCATLTKCACRRCDSSDRVKLMTRGQRYAPPVALETTAEQGGSVRSHFSPCVERSCDSIANDAFDADGIISS